MQKSQFRGTVAHDQPVFVMSDAPTLVPVLEPGPWLESRDVVGPADVVSEVPADILEKLRQVPYRLTPPPSWSQLHQRAAPLGQAFAVVGPIHGALLNDFARLQANLSQRRSPRPAGAFKEVPVEQDEALRERLRIVRILAHDLVPVNPLNSLPLGYCWRLRRRLRSRAEAFKNNDRIHGQGDQSDDDYPDSFRLHLFGKLLCYAKYTRSPPDIL